MLISVRHNFETAHRLPFLEGKCQNIHGHSWWVEWTIEASMDHNGLTVDFGIIKKSLREWVDMALDHGAMLGRDDSLLKAFQDDGSKVFIFGEIGSLLAEDLPWPTVEAVAKMLARMAYNRLALPLGQRVVQVEVTEKHDNKATWTWGGEGL